jgi:2-dehydro-3-deoxyglucarate aldolase/4-hydroxy-2-oxoheptanedioate aldolase
MGHDHAMSDLTSTPLPPLPPRGGLRQRVLAGEPTIGAWVNLGSLTAAELVARAGLDWVVLDLEHGMGSEADIHAQLLAVQGTPTTALVRVPSVERLRIGRALDLGADGLVLPRVDSAAEVADALRSMRFPPAGIRGVALLNRGNGYFERGHADLAATVNARIVGVFQVESLDAVASADELAAIEGVDVLFVGPADLSHSMGIPGQFSERAFTDALDAVVAACGRHGKSAGILLADASFVPAYRERGFTFLGIGSDAGWVVQGARAQVSAARAALSRTGAAGG